MAAGYDELHLQEDADFRAVWTVYADEERTTRQDISDWLFQAAIADEPNGSVWTGMTTAGSTFVNSESAAAGIIALWGGADGLLRMFVHRTTVSALAGTKFVGWLTINANNGESIERLLEGRVAITRSAT